MYFLLSHTLPCFQISLYQIKIKIKCKKCGLCQYVELYNISCILHIRVLPPFPECFAKGVIILQLAVQLKERRKRDSCPSLESVAMVTSAGAGIP